MRILKAELRLTNDNPNLPELRMTGNRDWLLTFTAMVFETMRREGKITPEDAIDLLMAEYHNMEVDDFTRISN